jgi:hypothetical protein
LVLAYSGLAKVRVEISQSLGIPIDLISVANDEANELSLLGAFSIEKNLILPNANKTTKIVYKQHFKMETLPTEC